MWRGIKWLISITVAHAAFSALYVSGIWLDLYGRNQPLGTIASTPLPADLVAARDKARRDAAPEGARATAKQIL